MTKPYYSASQNAKSQNVTIWWHCNTNIKIMKFGLYEIIELVLTQRSFFLLAFVLFHRPFDWVDQFPLRSLPFGHPCCPTQVNKNSGIPERARLGKIYQNILWIIVKTQYENPRLHERRNTLVIVTVYMHGLKAIERGLKSLNEISN